MTQLETQGLAAKQAARRLADLLARRGVAVKAADLARADLSACVADAFQYSTLVCASASYDGGLFPPMEDFLHHLRAKTFRNRRAALVENGTWAPSAGKCMRALLEEMKGIQLREETVLVPSTLKPETEAALEALAEWL